MVFKLATKQFVVKVFIDNFITNQLLTKVIMSLKVIESIIYKTKFKVLGIGMPQFPNVR